MVEENNFNKIREISKKSTKLKDGKSRSVKLIRSTDLAVACYDFYEADTKETLINLVEGNLVRIYDILLNCSFDYDDKEHKAVLHRETLEESWQVLLKNYNGDSIDTKKLPKFRLSERNVCGLVYLIMNMEDLDKSGSDHEGLYKFLTRKFNGKREPEFNMTEKMFIRRLKLALMSLNEEFCGTLSNDQEDLDLTADEDYIAGDSLYDLVCMCRDFIEDAEERDSMLDMNGEKVLSWLKNTFTELNRNRKKEYGELIVRAKALVKRMESLSESIHYEHYFNTGKSGVEYLDYLDAELRKMESLMNLFNPKP